MNNVYDDLLKAAQRHGMPIILLGPGLSSAEDTESEFIGRHDEPDGVAGAGNAEAGGSLEEVRQLRDQVQGLTAEHADMEALVATLRAQLSVATATSAATTAAPQVPGGAETPVGDNGALRDQGADVLGLADDKLLNKLIRLGYDTVGKVSDAYLSGNLAAAKLKKDWLLDVGMAVLGLFARHGSPAPATGGAVATTAAVTTDVPEGHADRPWTHRLGMARDKHAERNAVVLDLANTRATYDARCKTLRASGEDPSDDAEVDTLGERIMELEESVKIVSAHCVVLKWSLGLNPLPVERPLDEALLEANLGPWMETPQPRVLAPTGT